MYDDERQAYAFDPSYAYSNQWYNAYYQWYEANRMNEAYADEDYPDEAYPEDAYAYEAYAGETYFGEAYPEDDYLMDEAGPEYYQDPYQAYYGEPYPDVYDDGRQDMMMAYC